MRRSDDGGRRGAFRLWAGRLEEALAENFDFARGRSSATVGDGRGHWAEARYDEAGGGEVRVEVTGRDPGREYPRAEALLEDLVDAARVWDAAREVEAEAAAWAEAEEDNRRHQCRMNGWEWL